MYKKERKGTFFPLCICKDVISFSTFTCICLIYSQFSNGIKVCFICCLYFLSFLFILNLDFFFFLPLSDTSQLVLHKNRNLFEEEKLYLTEIEKLYYQIL